MRADGVYDVDANTSIDQLSEDLNIKMPEVVYFYFMFYSFRNLLDTYFSIEILMVCEILLRLERGTKHSL